MPSSRLSLRLGQLPHDVLADLAARLCSDSPALQAIAEECMAAHKPLSHELVERVLLSPDLVPSILGPLETEDWAAAAVCSQWLAGWQATNEPRRRLKQVALDLPEKIGDTNRIRMTCTPDGRLVVDVYPRDEVHILDRSMRHLQTQVFICGGIVAASDDAMFHVGDGALYRSSYDRPFAVKYQLEGHFVFSSVLASCGLLFCGVDGDELQIIALDAQTLQLRHRFGFGLLSNANQLAVVGDELYVSDTNNHRLQVFSFTGEHRRSVTGEWRSPEYLCCAKDRLYLVEDAEDGDEAYESQGRRILVLSLQGDILQVVTHPSEPAAFFTYLCCFDRKLLASFVVRSAGIHTLPKHGVLALRGL